MKTIELKTSKDHCRIIIGGILKDVSGLISKGRLAIITDQNVSHFYKNSFPNGLLIEIKPGEKSKTSETVDSIYEKLLDYELDRRDFILGIGGGVVCDVAGFVASTYMRGVRFGFVASSLLAQVDASIGGKNGINLKGFKNIIGVIKQPEFIISDLNMLKTLDRKEFISGIAEVIKYGAIMDKNLFEYCESHSREIINMDPEIIEEMVFRSASNKVKLVQMDEYESGERMKLNYGHTFAHALEKITGISHGEAVANGMCIAGAISVSEGLLSEDEANRLKSLIQVMGLPVDMKIDPVDISRAIRKDKKKSGNMIGLILLRKLGGSVIHNIDIDRLGNILNDLYSNSK